MSRRNTSDTPPQKGKWRTRLGVILGGLAVLGACVAIRYFWGGESASADQPRQTAPASAARRTPAARSVTAKTTTTDSSASTAGLVALVNGDRITRSQLAAECLRHYGEQVLESLVNKYLIAQECKRRNVVVSKEDVDAEIRRMAERFSLPVDQWLKMLKQERGITATQYANDIIWPTLALRRLAGSQLQVTREELLEAYDMRYGPAVRVRLIACTDPEKAQEVRARAAARPDQFGELAKKYSEDVPSAAAEGIIPPIRKHTAHEKIEQAAFSMSDGQVSQVIQAGGQYVILRRERLIPGAQAANFEQLAPQLEELIRDSKLRSVAHDVFRKLQQDSKVVNVLNGRPIPLDQLAEHCAQRHGQEVLDGMIHRTLIKQACRERGITVTEEEMDEEIARAAAAAIDLKEDGSPDVETWLKLVTQEQGVSEEVYRRDAVWPSVALRKLVAGTIQITEEDLQKAFEASYGARVQCRAIVLDNLRRANTVWDMARKSPTAEKFGDLAEQYSVEPQSQALRGEVPPIQKHGGQPLLEREAFALRPGELSGVIQLDDHYVILFCEGHTEPADVTFEEVRDELRRTIFEKKQRLAMADVFERLKDSASIDNYLAGTTHRPKRQAEPQRDTPRPIGPQQRIASPEVRKAPERR